ncbi:MAG: Recombination protein RecR [Candidatus Moranbacteria bacterium GW2011_GWE2_35_2-]|nr:MAG: Recombination protein RecR [Candidatus Moranbacteria bacterium GW2011_GWE2_35_2-]KKQ04206.1 MAG: Recombination protein RecR [Candidatus Moranbacteria bacterium GW2011_GWF1_36_4]KKQ22769.1 MAG: Recombination protein RecR [Candidatus Moranbacteria bacterium GW2011_GWF2_37_11]KKQ28923.1 MAG: Recombination protein RecR [Candidatus Moranbacteria bacterium GW2011_GWD1_37_17]KKQ31000.1 MAG: Recombination protein RecR [Candidatus Moranbacteria bacterium GW2011_GWE1_37_24]
MYPKVFKNLITHFSSLPSVGPKMAERLVLFLFKQNQDNLDDFAKNLLSLKDLKFCQKCFNISEDLLCHICQDKQRSPKVICVVEDPLDVISIERTGIYRGLYHILGGTMQSSGKLENNDLKIPQLLNRAKDEEIEEIILATNPTTEGDLTALYLKRKLESLGIKITRLGRGMSTGGDIEYADEITLGSALTNRKEL